jgi:histidinol phosphatase-like enzyme (inositol monophosphatase family)
VRRRLRHFRSDEMCVESKGAAFDPVTAADREAETAMRAWLARHRPEDGVLGEEFGATEGASGNTWVIDPIDGTRAFLSGAPTWGVLIALSGRGRSAARGDRPALYRRAFCRRDGRAWMEGPQGGRAAALPAPAPAGRGDPVLHLSRDRHRAERAAFEALAARVRLTRFGMDCYAYALLAAGQIDLVVEAGLHPYDIHAPIAVIEAAGGVVTDWTRRARA